MGGAPPPPGAVTVFESRRPVPLLASIDSPLGSLSASFVTDVYRPLLARGRSERHYLRVSRVAMLAFGIVLGLLAWAFSLVTGQMLWVVFKVAGVTSRVRFIRAITIIAATFAPSATRRVVSSPSRNTPRSEPNVISPT